MGQIIVSTWSFGERANTAGWPALLGPDPGRIGGRALEAAVVATTYAEMDATVDSVGYGGLPDARGLMSLDGAVMLGPEHFGGVCGVRRHMHPAMLGRLVMEHTEHGLLCGEDADRFADAHGMEEAALLSPESRACWEKWRSQPAQRQESRAGAARILPIDQGPGTGRLFGHDTIGTIAMDSQGILAAACSTSGLAFKVPGRVGDSPIVGHGLYVQPGVGAAVATGTGELISGLCLTFLAVETLRRKGSPCDAVGDVLRRVDELKGLQAHHQVAIIVMGADGTIACGACRPGFRAAIRDDAGSRVVESDLVSQPNSTGAPESIREDLAREMSDEALHDDG